MGQGSPLALALAILALALSSCERGCAPAVQGTVGPAAPVRSGEREVVLEPAAPGTHAPEPARELTWVYERSPVGLMHVVITIPAHAPAERLPVLVTLHGRGEAHKGAALGARGWVDDYGLRHAVERLGSPPLTVADFQGMVTNERLRAINASLKARPFQPFIVVCPFTPDILASDRAFTLAEPFERFVVDDLLPRVKRETPAIGSRESTAIDGVSLGGRAALLVGLARPEAFGAVAALQPAFDSTEIPPLTVRASAAVAKRPDLALRLLTSERDFFLAETRAIAAAWKGAGITVELDVVVGNHSYEFNRGPGVYEMLLWHARHLRGARETPTSP